jgi:hypothetical protein
MISVINKTIAQIKEHKLLIKLNYRFTTGKIMIIILLL